MDNKKSILEKVLLTYLPVVGTLTMVVSYMPQLYMTYTTKNVAGQSISFWILLSIGLAAMLGQQIGVIKYNGVKAKTGLVFQSLNLTLALAMLVGVIIFS